MKMFTTCTVQTDEEFAVWLKQHSKKMLPFLFLGVVAVMVSIFNEEIGWIENSRMNGVFSGFGSGLIGVALGMQLRNRRILHDPSRLHQMRLKYTDERNQAIGQKALASSAYLTIFACYVAMLVAGWFSTVAFWCFCGVMMFILLSYTGLYFYYNKKM